MLHRAPRLVQPHQVVRASSHRSVKTIKLWSSILSSWLSIHPRTTFACPWCSSQPTSLTRNSETQPSADSQWSIWVDNRRALRTLFWAECTSRTSSLLFRTSTISLKTIARGRCLSNMCSWTRSTPQWATLVTSSCLWAIIRSTLHPPRPFSRAKPWSGSWLFAL